MIKVQYDKTTKIITDMIVGKNSGLPARENCSIVELETEIPDGAGFKYNEKEKSIIKDPALEAEALQKEQEEKLIQEKIREIAIAKIAEEKAL